jgi:hypothetical protein
MIKETNAGIISAKRKELVKHIILACLSGIAFIIATLLFLNVFVAKNHQARQRALAEELAFARVMAVGEAGGNAVAPAVQAMSESSDESEVPPPNQPNQNRAPAVNNP